MDRSQVIKASSVTKEYHLDGSTVTALKDVDFEVSENEFITVNGPSGAGKTTLLNLIGGLDKPTSGKVIVLGHDLATYDEDFLATFRCTYIGYVFQSYNLISTLTALENVAFPMQLADWPDERIVERSRELLSSVGLMERADHFPSQLSGGEMQRVAFARALANDPPIVLVDEPTGNLDARTSLKIVQILKRLKGEKTVIVATHDERIIEISDRTIFIEDGRIVHE